MNLNEVVQNRLSVSGCRVTLGCLDASPEVMRNNVIISHQHHFSKFNHLDPLCSGGARIETYRLKLGNQGFVQHVSMKSVIE